MDQLDRIWNGWRSVYVAGAAAGRVAATPDDAATQPTSVFAEILSSGLDDTITHIVHRGRRCFAILNAFPYTTGHLLVLPYRVVGELELLTDEEYTELFAIVRAGVVAAKVAYHPDGVNVGINLGRAAGGSVDQHVHVHVVPRWAGDGNFMTSVANARTLPEPLEDTDQKYRAAWPSTASDWPRPQ